jgi:hypothetical protein
MQTAEVTADGVIDCIGYVRSWRRRQLGQAHQAPWCLQSSPFSTLPAGDQYRFFRPGMQVGTIAPHAVVSHQVVSLHPISGPQLQIQNVAMSAHQVGQCAASLCSIWRRCGSPCLALQPTEMRRVPSQPQSAETRAAPAHQAAHQIRLAPPAEIRMTPASDPSLEIRLVQPAQAQPVSATAARELEKKADRFAPKPWPGRNSWFFRTKYAAKACTYLATILWSSLVPSIKSCPCICR